MTLDVVRACDVHGLPLEESSGDRMRCPGNADVRPHLVVTWVTVDARTGNPLARAAIDERQELRAAARGDAVLAAIRKTAGNAASAARIVGCSRETVYNHLRARGLAPAGFRASAARPGWRPPTPTRPPAPRVGAISRLDAIDARLAALEALLRELLAR